MTKKETPPPPPPRVSIESPGRSIIIKSGREDKAARTLFLNKPQQR